MPLSAPRRVPICTASLATDRNLRPAFLLELSPRARVRVGAWLRCAVLRRAPPAEFSFSGWRREKIGGRRHQPAQTRAFAPYTCRYFPGLLETPIKMLLSTEPHVKPERIYKPARQDSETAGWLPFILFSLSNDVSDAGSDFHASAVHQASPSGGRHRYNGVGH